MKESDNLEGVVRAAADLGHEASVAGLLAGLEARKDFRTVRLSWASGLLMAVRVLS